MSTTTLPRRTTTGGPNGSQAAIRLGMLLRDPLAGYLGMSARYGDAIRVPIGPRQSLFMLSRPEHAEHVLAGHQTGQLRRGLHLPATAGVDRRRSAHQRCARSPAKR